MATIKVIQVKSAIDRPKSQKATLKALGLGKLNKLVELNDNPQVNGMLKKVDHLITILN